jgi:hypothetical protein
VAAAAPEDPETALRHLAERALALLGDDGVDAASSGEFLAPLLTRYLERFQRLPLERPGNLLRRLDLGQMSEEELLDWSIALDNHFEQRFGKPLREDRAAQAALKARQDNLLREYRDMVARLETQEALLHQTLDRLYAYIDNELPEARLLRAHLATEDEGNADVDLAGDRDAGQGIG